MPARRRPPQVFEQRLVNALNSRTAKGLGGRVANASPVLDRKLQAQLRSLAQNTAASSSDTGTWHYDEFVIASAATTTYTLTHIPVNDKSAHVQLNGVTLREGADYTLDYTTGIITVSVPLTVTPAPADVLMCRYESVGGTTMSVLVDWTATGWKYKQVLLSDTTDYSGAGYDDSTWTVGQAAFGGGGSSPVNTAWTPQSYGTSMWLRRSVVAVTAMRMTIKVDNQATVWVNGHQVLTNIDGADNGTLIRGGPYDIDISALLATGNNVIAIRADDLGPYAAGNATYIDARIEGVPA